MTALSIVDAAALQESWDRQQESYAPDREHRFAAMLDAVAAVADAGPVRLPEVGLLWRGGADAAVVGVR